MPETRPSARIIAGLAVLLLAGGLAWWLRKSQTPAPVEDSGNPAAHTDLPAPPDTPGPGPMLTGVPETPPDPASAPATGASDTSEDAASSAKAWTLTFTCFSDGRPHKWSRAVIYTREGKDVAEKFESDGDTAEFRVRGGAYFSAWAFGHVPWTSAWLTPPASGAMHLEVHFEKGKTVSGRVFEQDGTTPLTSGQVRATWRMQKNPFRPAAGSQNALVQRDGRFVVKALRDGPVFLLAKPYDFKKGRPNRVQANAGDRDVRIVLSPSAGIALRVIDAATGMAPQSKQQAIYTVEADGSERSWSRSSRNSIGEPQEAKPSAWLQADLGKTYRFRVKALGYEPSDIITVPVPKEGGMQVVDVPLRASPQEVARVTFRIDTREHALPKWIYIAQHRGQGSMTTTGYTAEDGRITLELIPGAHHITVGRTRGTHPDDPDLFWIPVQFRFELASGEEREIPVVLARGGWAWISGDPDPRPRTLRLTRGEEVRERYAGWGSFGKKREKGFFVGGLPAGTWTLEYGEREEGRRTTFEVRVGQVTRLDPETFEKYERAEEK